MLWLLRGDPTAIHVKCFLFVIMDFDSLTTTNGIKKKDFSALTFREMTHTENNTQFNVRCRFVCTHSYATRLSAKRSLYADPLWLHFCA